jgi:hypothetical protein
MSCVQGAQTLLAGFLQLCSVCEDDHWRPQQSRVDNKYWPYIDVIGHVESASEDAKTLLQRVGAWEEYGKSGWGEFGNSSIFESEGASGAGTHVTWAQWQVWKWCTPEVELEVSTTTDYDNITYESNLWSMKYKNGVVVGLQANGTSTFNRKNALGDLWLCQVHHQTF